MDYLSILKQARATRHRLDSSTEPVPTLGSVRNEKNELYEESPQDESRLSGQTIEPSPSQAIGGRTCKCDWKDGYHGRRLHCVAHPAHGGTTVFRLVSGGYDTLAELLRLEMLTGEALADAQRPR